MKCEQYRTIMRTFSKLEIGLEYYDRLKEEFMYFEYCNDHIDLNVYITHISNNKDNTSFTIIFEVQLHIGGGYKNDIKIDKDIMRIAIDSYIRKVDHEFDFSIKETKEDSSKDFIEKSTNTIKNKINFLETFLNHIINEENSRRKEEG